MSFESQATKEAKEKINKEKAKMEVKNIKDNSSFKTAVTVILTLVSVAALAIAFISGMNYQKSINDDVKTQVKDLSAIVSKTEQ